MSYPNMVRYYKGKIKCLKMSVKSPLGTALYLMLEDGEMNPKRFCQRGEIVVFPVRLGWRKKRKSDSK